MDIRGISPDLYAIYQNDIYISYNERHNYNTRHNHALQINTGNGEIVYKRVSFHGVHIWNHISPKNPIDVSYACFSELSKMLLKKQ